MGKTIDQEMFTRMLFAVLDETFEKDYGIFLDKGTSLFETLENISAAEASRPVGGKCASLAAQVAHVNFYLGVLEGYAQGKDAGRVDWGEIWRTVKEVTPEAWDVLQQQLRQTYQHLRATLDEISWDNEQAVGGGLAIVAHTAYHLGEIRQALCTLKE